MEKIETIERFKESLKKAASHCRSLAKAQQNNSWLQVADQLEVMLARGEQIYRSKAISRQAALSLIDNFIEKKKKDV